MNKSCKTIQFGILSSIAFTGFGSAATTIVAQDVTSSLGGSITFEDTAATGGGDVTAHDNVPRSFNRTWDLGAGAGSTGTITIADLGFGTSGAAAANDATSVSFTVTYLGVDGVVGGGDDVVIGTESVGYTHSGAGQYYGEFSDPSPLTAIIDGLSNVFRVTVVPDDNDAGLQESIRFKTLSGGAPKLSFSGSFTSVPEPSSSLLIGLCGLFGFLHRRR